jgi:hypothetical protein
MECTSFVLLTIFGLNCHTYILITSRKHDLCTDEEPKYKKKVIVAFVREMELLNGGVGISLTGE